jgi:PAS domain S-box-containing protein
MTLTPISAAERDKLQKSLAVIRATQEASPDGILIIDEQRAVAGFNRRFGEMWGIPQDVLATGDDQRLLAHVLSSLAEPDEFLRRVEYLYQHPLESSREEILMRDGRVFERHSAPVASGGESLGRVWFFRDVTARRLAEEARTKAEEQVRALNTELERRVADRTAELRASEHRLRALLGCSRGAVFEFDAEGRYLNVWAEDESLLVRPRAEVLGRSVREVIPHEATQFIARIARVLATGKGESYQYQLAVAAGLHWFHADLVRAPPEPGKAPSVVLLSRDASESKKMEASLFRSERLAAVGTLAAGVAHEINNPLAYVVGNIDYSLARLEKIEGPEIAGIHEALAEAGQGAERVRLIVRDLMLFARDSEEESGPVDVARVLDGSINMAFNEIRHRAQLERSYAGVPLVHCNERRLGQVFLNLLVNAAHAIEVGRFESNRIRVSISSAGRRVVVRIADSGRGIAPEHLDRIFDPFFTTKAVGEGTGLGLSICHAIVTGMGGDISVTSQPGQGTVFTLSLPAAQEEQPPTPTPEKLPATWGRRPRLLLVDDEPALLRSLRRQLAGLADVVTIGSGREALELLLRDSSFDLVLCDLMMPDMTGMDLHQRLTQERPDLIERIVWMTGGAFTPQALQFLSQFGRRRLEKPVSFADLTALVAWAARPGPARSAP